MQSLLISQQFSGMDVLKNKFVLHSEYIVWFFSLGGWGEVVCVFNEMMTELRKPFVLEINRVEK